MRTNQSIKLVDLIGSSEIATLGGMDRMRAATVCAMAISIPLMAAAAWAQNNATVSERLGALAQRANPGPCPGNPEALGVARVVEIDTTGGPGFGFEHFKAYDFLRSAALAVRSTWVYSESVCHSPHSRHSKVYRSGSPPNRSVLRTSFIG